MRNPSTQQLESYVQKFASKWDTAPKGSEEREIQRRNCFLGLFLLADQEIGVVLSNEADTAISGLKRLHCEPQWQARRHLLFASIHPMTPEVMQTDAIHLLQSLEAGEQPVSYDLSITVP